MMNGVQEVHRPGAFKQPNKPHKTGRHRSKGSISNASQGKLDKVGVKLLLRRKKRELNRDERRNQSVQIRKNKRDEVLAKKRCIGGLATPPFLVCVLPLRKDFDPTRIVLLLSQCDSEAIVKTSNTGITHICLPRFKQRFSFVVPPRDNEWAILDSLKICDTVLFLITASDGYENESSLVDKWGNKVLLTALSQGLPTPVVAVTDIEEVPLKKRNKAKQAIQKLVTNWFPDEKILFLDKEHEALTVLRRIGNQKIKKVHFRDRRPHLYAEHVEYVPDEQGTFGTLKVTGFLRGSKLSVNDLVHIPGLGDFQMSEIDLPDDPYALEKKREKNTNGMDLDNVLIRILEKSDPSKQESLESENEVNPLDSEQNWPTEEEMKCAEEEIQNEIRGETKKRKVPAGWSDYQAAWLPEDEELVSNDSENESGEDECDMQLAPEEEEEESFDEKFETMNDATSESEIAVDDDKYDQQMDFLEEKNSLLKLKEAKMDLEFPDEVDTPQDAPARIRFQKYRGLESFRTSPWDPNENLPSDYARIFKFMNFDRSRRAMLKSLEDKTGAEPGMFITIHVTAVSELLWTSFKSSGLPLIVIGMFPNEHKMTVVNTVLRRTPDFPIAIKAKEKLVFQVGYRRFTVNPIFSEHTNGNKHKFERFFQPGSTTVATFFAPIQFPPAPVLCYKEVNGALMLIATGGLLSCNADRLVIKRIVLSGYPFKIRKRSSIIRYMFFNREDIMYFKKINLRTKHGLNGHIVEPLGTHGHMKAYFSGQLKSQDTVMMIMYKRIFPKWTYENLDCLNNNNADCVK